MDKTNAFPPCFFASSVLRASSVLNATYRAKTEPCLTKARGQQKKGQIQAISPCPGAMSRTLCPLPLAHGQGQLFFQRVLKKSLKPLHLDKTARGQNVIPTRARKKAEHQPCLVLCMHHYSRSRTRRTDVACHLPPLAVSMPCSFSLSAICFKFKPSSLQGRMTRPMP